MSSINPAVANASNVAVAFSHWPDLGGRFVVHGWKIGSCSHLVYRNAPNNPAKKEPCLKPYHRLFSQAFRSFRKTTCVEYDTPEILDYPRKFHGEKSPDELL